jgi:hypothetical protein
MLYRSKLSLPVLSVPLLLALAPGCGSDKCEEEVPSFQLDVTAQSAQVAQIGSLIVAVEVGEERFRRSFDVADQFADGTASLGVRVEPAPTSTFNVTVTVEAYSQAGGQGDLVSQQSANFVASPNGCNRQEIALPAGGPGPDGGARDAGADQDTGVIDAGAEDTGTPDAGFPDADAPDIGTPDMGTPDTGSPDAGFPDTGSPDAGFPDAGPDAGFVDAGPDAGSDAGFADAGPDAGFPDAGPDAGFPDAGFPDVGFPDVGFSDVGFPDVGFPDVGFPDAGFPDTGVDAGAADAGCVAEIVGDGVDQDCDGVDRCYEDLDDDGFGSAIEVNDNDLDCTNNSALTAVTSNDCHDGSGSIFPNAPEIVADGIDQSCNFADACYEDLDTDGFGTTTVVNDTDLDCDNASAATSSDNTDCDDTDLALFPTMVCDDGDACTVNDSCVPGACFGYVPDGSCACSGTCPSPGGCCTQACAGGSCPDCSATSACEFDCTGEQTCTALCETGSVCRLNHEGPNTAPGPVTTDLTCASGSSCELDCRRRDGNESMTCTIDCLDGAICLMDRCQAGATCSITCPSGATTCAGGRIVCGRGCP